MNRIFQIFVFLFLSYNFISAEDFRTQKILAGYYPDWGVWKTPSYTVDLVPYDKLTHVIWSFISPNADGTLRGDVVDDASSLDEMVSLAHSFNKKVIISLGGAGLCEHFANVASDDNLRKKFVDELMNFITIHNLDGVDMDWEFSSVPVSDNDTIAYNKLIKDIRYALPINKSFSAALPCSDYYGKYFTVEVLLDNLDWFQIMTYDITGDWDDKARFDSPLFPNSKWTTWSWKQSLDYWNKRGVLNNKLVFGVPSFGFLFSGANGPGSDFNAGKTQYVDYAKVVENNNWEFFYDEISKEPYGVYDGYFVTFENEKSVTEKANWILENEMAGIMVWELSQDYMEKEQPIIFALSKALFKNSVSEKIIRDNLSEKLIQKKYYYDALGKCVKYHDKASKQLWYLRSP